MRKAVKWNSPLYGSPDQEGWFLSLHCFDRCVKVAFQNGGALTPPPPAASRPFAISTSTKPASKALIQAAARNESKRKKA